MEKRKNVYSIFTIIFLIFVLVGLIPTEIKTGYPLGFGLFTDGIKQHLIFMRDYVINIKNFFNGNPLRIYRFDIGLGSDFFMSFGYYSLFDPLTIIAYLIPIKYIEFSYYLIAVTRIYLAGIFIIWLAKEYGIQKKYSLLTVALFYCFNVTVLYSAFRHPFFTNGPMLFPLVILGAERIIRGKGPFLLILASFLGLITQFYFYIYTSFGFLLFVIIRLIPKIKKESFLSYSKSIANLGLIYSLGAFLGGFVLVPQFLATVLSGRASSKGFVFYNAYDLLTYLSSFFIPVIGSRYSPTIGNFVVFYVVLIFIFNQKKSWEKPYFLILSVLLFISFFGYLINVCSYINNRWTYLMLLPAALMLGKVVDNQEGVTDVSVKKANKAFLVLVSLVVVLAILALLESVGKTIFIVGLLVLLPLEYLLIRKILKTNFKAGLKKYLNSKLLLKYTLIVSFLMILGISFASGFFVTVSEGLSGYSDKEAFTAIYNDQGFYRVDQNKYFLDSDFLSNDNLVYGFPAPYAYNTMNNGYINDTIEFFNVVNHNNSVGYNGFNERSALNSINHVKYLIVRESEKISIPYGFKLYDTIQLEKFAENRYNRITNTGAIEYDGKEKVYETAYIFRNENFIDFGFVYHQYIKENSLEQFSSLSKENILLEAAILAEDCELPRYEAEDLKPMKPQKFELENIILEEGKIISGDEGTISFTVNNLEEAELYVEILGLKASDSLRGFTVRYETDLTYHEERGYKYGTNFYIDNQDHLLRIGYFEKGNLEVRIIFEAGEYEYEEINYYLNPVASFEEKINNLNSETLQNLQFKSNGFSGSITLNTPGLLFISLPYSEGFTAYVNGVKTGIKRVNIGYMGIMLEAGTHDIMFVYETPGMKYGIILSLLAMGAVASIGVFRTIKKHKKSREHNETN